MAESPSHGPDPAEWFLQAPGGKSRIRITAGLVIGEDDRGHFEIGPDTAFPLLRFDLAGGALCLIVAAREWVLATPQRMVGDSYRVHRSVELRLPNNDFRIVGGRSDDRQDEEPERLELNRRYALTWLKPTATETEPAPAARADDPKSAPRSPDEADPEGRANPTAEDRDAPLPTAEGHNEPIRPAPRTPVAELFSPAQAGGYAADRRPALQTTPRPRRSARPGAYAASERRARSRMRSESQPRWSVTLLVIVVYLVALTFSEPVQTPVATGEPPEAGPGGAPAAHSDDALLASVEALLRGQSPPDQSTLDFAVKAYRAASSRRPDDAGLRRRLAELESAAPSQ